MNYAISTDKSTLTLECTPAEQAELRDMLHPGCLSFNTDQEIQFCERLTCNSELDWINPADTGDLTDAPLLGILGEEGTKEHTVFLENYGLMETGGNGHWTMARPILQRWGYPHYQVRSFLDDLMQTGKAVFLNSW